MALPLSLPPVYFYPRSPCGERLHFVGAALAPKQFLSTLSLRRATHTRKHKKKSVGISIHALLAESDWQNQRQNRRAGSFLSTLSLRRATALAMAAQSPDTHFYPRSPCGERRRKGSRRCVLSGISIHALLAESDSKSAQNSGALLRI